MGELSTKEIIYGILLLPVMAAFILSGMAVIKFGRQFYLCGTECSFKGV